MQVFPVSTVEPAERFTRLTTTAVRANKTTPAKTARTVSYIYLSLFAGFSTFRNFTRAED